MRLDEYQWSRNPRGLHVARILETPLLIDRWRRPGFGWVKLVAIGTEYVDDAVNFLAAGITPILRIYVQRFGAQPFNRQMLDLTNAYINAGVKWFEFYNEPNLGVEWPDGFDPDWRDMNNVVRPMMENWLLWAEYIVSQGCYPGFTALAESATQQYSSILWMDAFLNYLAENEFTRFQRVMENGLYVATHPYILNHFYQELPGGGPLTARAALAENANEGGWHFEYPYDPISQSNDPGRTIYGGTARTPFGDPDGLTAMGLMFNQRASQIFGGQAIPVVGTEGGIWPFRNGFHQQDTRYPSYSERSQAEATAAMFNWIAAQAPPWFFGVCVWKEDEYYNDNYIAPAVDRLTQIAPPVKNVPSLEVMGSSIPLGPDGRPIHGPGPIHGPADFHMIILAPGLDSSWFFDTAQPYWNTFRPMVTDDVGLIDFIGYNQSLAATVIAPSDLADVMVKVIQGQYPNVWFDLIVADDLQTVTDTLNQRVRVNRRFG